MHFLSLYFEIKNASTGWQSQMSQYSWRKTKVSCGRANSHPYNIVSILTLTPWDCWYVIISNVDAFRGNRSQQDAIYTALHSVFTHMEKNSCIRMLFVDFRLAFITIWHTKMLKLCKTLHNWILDFLTACINNIQNL